MRAFLARVAQMEDDASHARDGALLHLLVLVWRQQPLLDARKQTRHMGTVGKGHGRRLWPQDADHFAANPQRLGGDLVVPVIRKIEHLFWGIDMRVGGSISVEASAYAQGCNRRAAVQ